MARRPGGWIYALVLSLIFSVSEGPSMAGDFSEKPLADISAEESLAGKYLREYYREGCIEGFKLPEDAMRGNILYMFHGERVGMPKGSKDPKDQFNLNLREKDFGTEYAKICDLKKGPYNTIMKMLDLDSWKLTEYPACWTLPAK
jgi:hypothetical protein